MDYAHCYEVLGLSPDADWARVRSQYRLLTSRLHPDRPGHETGAYSLAETNNAYRALKSYYRKHETLPLARRLPASSIPFQRHPPSARRRRPLVLWLVGATLVLYGYYHWQGSPPPPEPLGDVPSGGFVTAPAPVQEIHPGDPLGRVAEALGPPDRRGRDRWYYGDAWIEFRDGHVADWHSSVDNPLPINALGARGSEKH